VLDRFYTNITKKRIAPFLPSRCYLIALIPRALDNFPLLLSSSPRSPERYGTMGYAPLRKTLKYEKSCRPYFTGGAGNGEGKERDEEGTKCHLRRSLIPSVIYRDPPGE